MPRLRVACNNLIGVAVGIRFLKGPELFVSFQICAVFQRARVLSKSYKASVTTPKMAQISCRGSHLAILLNFLVFRRRVRNILHVSFSNVAKTSQGSQFHGLLWELADRTAQTWTLPRWCLGERLTRSHSPCHHGHLRCRFRSLQ
jgi:hypothetical protein